MDIVLAVLVFFAAFIIFYIIIGQKPDTKVSNLRQEASVAVNQISTGENLYRVVDGNELNDSRLGMLNNTDYDELKRIMRTDGDFCIYIEDGSGEVVRINDSYRGIGSENIILDGVPCNQ